MTVTVATYSVPGISCQHCVNALNDEIGLVPGVRRVDVHLARGEVTVTSDRPLAREAVAAAVDEAGYQLV
jgi:copper ion binding protein